MILALNETWKDIINFKSYGYLVFLRVKTIEDTFMYIPYDKKYNCVSGNEQEKCLNFGCQLKVQFNVPSFPVPFQFYRNKIDKSTLKTD